MRPGLAGSHLFAELDDESDSGEDEERQDQPEDQESTLHPYAIQAAAGEALVRSDLLDEAALTRAAG